MKPLLPLKIGLGIAAGVTAICATSWVSAQYRERDGAEPPAGKMISTTQGHVFVQEWGDPKDPTLLLVHGTMAWSGFWERTAQYLVGEGWHVTALDLPPFGYSDRVDDYSTPAQAIRITEVAQAVSDTPPIVVGHSFGAGPVMEAALTEPESFSGVVVVNAALGIGAPEKELPWALRADAAREVAVSLSMTNPIATKALVRSFLTYPDTLDDKTVEVLQAPLGRQGTTAAYAKWSAEFLAPSPAVSRSLEAYEDLNVPFGILWSEFDEVTPLIKGQELAHYAPNRGLTILKDSGHIPQIETPALFEKELAKMLQTVSRDAP